MQVMNIEKLAKNALQFLKNKEVDFPKFGIIAGGSLANLIWEQVSGNIAVVNDIDVFVFEQKLKEVDISGETFSKDKKKMFYRSQEKIYWKDYTGLCEGSKTRDFYLIERTENVGLFNFVYYSATSESTELIIDSFDINCTQIAYNIQEDKFYWTKEFEQFLEDGNLKLTNLGSPHHSAIRITKKRDDLNANLDEEEIKIAAFAISRALNGITRRYFSDKYYNYFLKYETELSKYFRISKEQEISSLIKEQKGIELGIYTLDSNLTGKEIFSEELAKMAQNKIWHVNDFLFYIRNIQNDPIQFKIWSKVQPLFSYSNYVDFVPDDQDLNLLSRLIENIPNCIKHLQGYTISEQVKIVNKLFECFSDDLTIAFSLLETRKIEPDIEFDEQTKLLLELSVRINIVNNNYNINKILGITQINGYNDYNDANLPF